MKSLRRLACATLPLIAASQAFAASGPFTLKVDGIVNDSQVPEINLLCQATPDGKSTPGTNKRPTIWWENAPKGAKSFDVIVSDPDVPADFTPANKDGVVIAEGAPRKLTYHWGRMDIPGNVERIAGGQTAVGVGQPAANDLKGYVKDSADFGGPCPPWNDARLHHYHFTVYALDVESLGMSTGTTAKQLAAKLENNPHVISKSEVVATYTLNKDLRTPPVIVPVQQ